MPTPIPLSRPDITQREIDAVVDVLHTPTLSIGPKVDEFEKLCAKVAGRRHAHRRLVRHGRPALRHDRRRDRPGRRGDHHALLLRRLRQLHPVSSAPSRSSWTSIRKTLNIDVDKVAAAITPQDQGDRRASRSSAIPAACIELEQIAQKHELILIEDACEGFGGHRPASGRIGSFGRAGVFGFYPNKQITTGEGGMIVTDDDTFAATCRALRNQGREGMAWLAHQRLGYNYRLSEINAALGVAQMRAAR